MLRQIKQGSNSFSSTFLVQIKIIFLFYIFLFYCSTSLGQINNLHHLSNESFLKSIIIEKPGHFYYSIIDKYGKFKVNDIDLLEMIDVIVEFKEEPLFLKLKSNGLLKINKSYYQAVFNMFQQDISGYTQAFSKRTSIYKVTPVIKKEFYRVFNGVNIEIPRGMLNFIHSLSYVKNVFPNAKVELIDETKPADKNISLTLNDSQVKGDSIVIGIIDTGIDYLHPVFGAGFGPGYKVIGGYDIIDEDNDPMDEIGHGTHVAGIAAANGDSLKGVAPNALLMAFKVFSQTKLTYESTILEAIEMAMDPNGDENYDDKSDVVNMSLGAAGNPEDPVSTAVNNATKIGTIFCVAVGNFWDYQTISTPANAELAIGVGANDEFNRVASFSSKGPTKKTYSIKPDVLAPGVSIYSAFLDNSYVYASGTSMSTPYVAGVCALIKSIHQDWTPEKIKSLIMTSATDLNEDIMAQGSGIINIDKALNTQTIILPPSLSFGFCDINSTVWITSDTITVRNESDIIKNYSVTISYPSEYLSVSPRDFSLNPEEEINVIVTLTVNNSSTPFIEEGSFSYNRNIDISCENESLHIPWAFVKAPRLVINFDKPAAGFLLFNKNIFYSTEHAGWDNDFKRCELIISNGRYDLHSTFLDVGSNNINHIKQVITEGINFNNYNELTISSSLAKNEITFSGTDEKGSLLSQLGNWKGNIFIYFPDSSLFLGAMFAADSGETINFSDITDRYTFYTGEFQQDLIDKHKVYVTQYKSFKGISTNHHLTRNLDYKKVRVNFSLSPFIEKHNYAFGNAFLIQDEYGGSFQSSARLLVSQSNANWTGILYITPRPDEELFFSTSIFADIINDNDEYHPWFLSDLFQVSGDSIGCYSYFRTPDIYFAPQNGLLSFGNGIPRFTLGYYFYLPYFTFSIGSYGQLHELRLSDMLSTSYSLINDEGEVISSGDCGMYETSEIPLSYGKYSLEFKNENYLIGEAIGGLNIKSNFTYDINYFSTLIPTLSSAQIRNANNAPVFVLNKGGSGTIQFSVGEYYNSPVKINVKTFIKEENSSEWTELAVQKILYDSIMGSFYKSDISSFTDYDSTALDVKIVLTNSIGENSTEIVWEPAVGVGKFRGRLPDSLIFYPPSVYQLYHNYPNPFNSTTTISYELPERAEVTLDIFNILGEKVTTLFDGIQFEGRQKIVWNTGNVASGVYFYRLIAEGKTFFQKVGKMILLR